MCACTYMCPCHYILSNYTELLPSPIQLTSTQLKYMYKKYVAKYAV